MDRICRQCRDGFTPSLRNQRYCDACRSKCSVDGCVRKPEARGYCRLHFNRLRLSGNLGTAYATAPGKPRGVPCEVDGCQRLSGSSGLCNMHYKRRQARGDAGGASPLIAAAGSGSIRRGYRLVRMDGRYILEHRLVMERCLGRSLMPTERVHHRDGDKLNNEIGNLELWSHTHPSGQRVADQIGAAIALLKNHSDELAERGFRLVPLESQASTDLLIEEGLDMYRLTPFMQPAVI